jgi:hypothetical protein
VIRFVSRHALGFLALFLVLAGGTAVALPGTDTVFSDDIVNGEVKGPDIEADAVNGGKIAPDAVHTGQIAENTIKPEDIATNGVGALEVATTRSTRARSRIRASVPLSWRA